MLFCVKSQEDLMQIKKTVASHRCVARITLGRYQSHKPSFLCDKVIIFTEMTSLNIFVRLHYIFVVTLFDKTLKNTHLLGI